MAPRHESYMCNKSDNYVCCIIKKVLGNKIMFSLQMLAHCWPQSLKLGPNIGHTSCKRRKKSILQVIADHHILLTNLFCLAAFATQFGNILEGYINP